MELRFRLVIRHAQVTDRPAFPVLPAAPCQFVPDLDFKGVSWSLQLTCQQGMVVNKPAISAIVANPGLRAMGPPFWRLVSAAFGP
jgi:hypothetical protein